MSVISHLNPTWELLYLTTNNAEPWQFYTSVTVRSIQLNISMEL